LLHELDGARNERFAAEVEFRFPFGGELLLDDVLGGDPGVGGGGAPQGLGTDQ
jgi:hypothetical protein